VVSEPVRVSTGEISVRVRDVCIKPAVHGGWNVTATVDGRVLATRHCGDWHRAERVCQQMKSGAQLPCTQCGSGQTVELLSQSERLGQNNSLPLR
jgi:hypothetical protein